MEVSANVRRTEPIPRQEQDGETYSAATRSRSTSTQPIAAPSTATQTSCSRIARATRSAAPRAAHLSACSLDIAGTASARMARRRILASASSSAVSARRICIKSLPRGPTIRLNGRRRAGPLKPVLSRAYATSRHHIHPLISGRRPRLRRHRDGDAPPRTEPARRPSRPPPASRPRCAPTEKRFQHQRVACRGRGRRATERHDEDAEDEPTSVQRSRQPHARIVRC
jgi:hypothetical protein